MGNSLGKKQVVLAHPLGYELLLKCDELENHEGRRSSTTKAEQPHRCGGGGGGGGDSVRIKVRMTVRELKELMAEVEEEDMTEIGRLLLEESLKGRWVGRVIFAHDDDNAKGMDHHQLGTIMEEEE